MIQHKQLFSFSSCWRIYYFHDDLGSFYNHFLASWGEYSTVHQLESTNRDTRNPPNGTLISAGSSSTPLGTSTSPRPSPQENRRFAVPAVFTGPYTNNTRVNSCADAVIDLSIDLREHVAIDRARFLKVA